MEKGGVNINYHNLTYPDMNNGEGLRVVLWLSGCSHKCKGCQNPQTLDANSGIPFDESAKEELFRELDKDYISGLTLTGGDPLFESNLDGVLDLVTEINDRYNTSHDRIRLSRPQKSIWIYSGYTWEDILYDESETKDIYVCDYYMKLLNMYQKRRKILSQCDVLIDGQYIDSQRDITLPYRGSANQRLIDIQQSLQKGEIVLWQT